MLMSSRTSGGSLGPDIKLQVKFNSGFDPGHEENSTTADNKTPWLLKIFNVAGKNIILGAAALFLVTYSDSRLNDPKMSTAITDMIYTLSMICISGVPSESWIVGFGDKFTSI